MAEEAARDPGLQPERTLLSWRRTVLTLIITDFLIWRAWLISATAGAAHSEGLGIAAAVLAAWFAFVMLTRPAARPPASG